MPSQAPPIVPFENQKAYRLIPSKFPLIDLFNDVAGEEEFSALFAVQSLTNPRLLNELRDIETLPRMEWPLGIKGCSWAMVPFTHINRNGSRFGNGEFGIYYAAEKIETAIKETVYHQQKWLSYTDTEPQDLDMRCLVCRFSAQLIDIRGADDRKAEWYEPEDYSLSQKFGSVMKKSDSEGIVYISVRDSPNTCFALFTPKVISEVIQGSHFGYVWDGAKIVSVYQKKSVYSVPAVT